ncbi:uncharacterized protein LOC127091716 [Lathyrus oleraceus]|uniref:uncharacterized protein LOC127091716 n=1 Tax=Pisum sativum TaxID=3888 RepID=UPI0021CECC3F|nr:uncharacterized protein LOC127091716 [Pisum sativum]
MGELYYLRMMLTFVKGPICYEDIKDAGGKILDSFRDACFEMGFLEDDNEYVAAINEAMNWGSGHFLRKLFVNMLLTNLPLLEEEIKNRTLIEIENLLQENRRIDLIIWDETPMCHKNFFEALDKTLKDVMGCHGIKNTIFGGKIVVFGGDFRQILLVVLRGGRSDILQASISSSCVWDYYIEVPEEILTSSFKDPKRAIVDNTYLNMLKNYKKEEFLQYIVILASTIEVVDKINHYVLGLISGEEKEYLSSDSIDRTKVSYSQAYKVLTPEFISSLRTLGLPNHNIKLKVATPIMLMRNLDQAKELCNGTRLIVTWMEKDVMNFGIASMMKFKVLHFSLRDTIG